MDALNCIVFNLWLVVFKIKVENWQNDEIDIVSTIAHFGVLTDVYYFSS